MKKNIIITVSRTVQIKQYEPLTISITENHDIDLKGNDVKEFRDKEKLLVKSLTKTVNKLILSQAEDLRD